MADSSELIKAVAPHRDPAIDRKHAALVYSRTLNAESAAKVTGISVSAIKNLVLHDKDFQDLVTQYTRLTATKVLTSITRSAVLAAKILRKELRSPMIDSKKVRTAKTVLELFFRASESFDIERRIAELEMGQSPDIQDAEIV